MRRIVERASWSLLVAGSLALGEMAPAQQPNVWRQPPSTLRAHDSRNDPGLSAAAGIADAMRIQIALLADPTTFACEVQARFNGSSIELHGQVPAESVRAQAVSLARQHTRSPVRDHLAVVARNIPRPPTSTPDEIINEARTSLFPEVLGALANTINIQADQDGHVILNGQLPKIEQSFAISMSCRRLKGCTCVTDRIEIVESQKTIAAAPSEPRPVSASAAPPDRQAAVVQATARTTLPPATPEDKPSPRSGVVSPNVGDYPKLSYDPPQQLQLPAQPDLSLTKPTPGKPLAPVKPPPAATPAVEDLVLPVRTPQTQPISMQSPRQSAPVTIITDELALPELPPAKPRNPNYPEWYPKTDEAASTPAAKPPLQVHAAAPAAPAPPAPPARVIIPATLKPTNPPLNGSFAQRASGPVPVASAPGWIGTGTISFGADAQQAPASNDPANHRIAIVRTDSTTRNVQLVRSNDSRQGDQFPNRIQVVHHEEPQGTQPPRGNGQPLPLPLTLPPGPTEPAHAAEMQPISAELLQRRIESVCGLLGHRVSVQVKSANEINVRLWIPSTEVGAPLFGKIKAMPELAPLKVHVEMQVEPAPG